MPEWINDLEPTATGDPNPKLLRATLLWREISDQQEEAFAAVEPDQSHTRLKDQWKKLENVRGRAIQDHVFGPYDETLANIPMTAHEIPLADYDPDDLDYDWPDIWDTYTPSDLIEPAPTSIDPGGLSR